MVQKNLQPISIIPFLAMVLLIVYAANHIQAKIVAESIQAVESNIRRAAVSCYAIEGAYPQNVEYLENHYGLQLDRNKYVIEYDIIGSNVMPWVAVAEKGTYYFDNSWS